MCTVPVTGACGKGESDDREAFPTEGAGGGGGGVGENGVEDPEICKLRAGTRPKKEVCPGREFYITTCTS